MVENIEGDSIVVPSYNIIYGIFMLCLASIS